MSGVGLCFLLPNTIMEQCIILERNLIVDAKMCLPNEDANIFFGSYLI